MRTRDESGRLARDRGPRVFCRGSRAADGLPGRERRQDLKGLYPASRGLVSGRGETQGKMRESPVSERGVSARSSRRSGALAVWAGLGLLSILAVEAIHARIPPSRDLLGGEAFVPEPGLARLLSLGFGAPVADFYWLQAIDREDLAFVVTDPSIFIPSYRVPIKTEQMRELNLESLDKGQVFVIVNKNQNTLTGNLQGPLVINAKQCVGEQLVLSNRRFTAREPLMELGVAAEMVSA